MPNSTQRATFVALRRVNHWNISNLRPAVPSADFTSAESFAQLGTLGLFRSIVFESAPRIDEVAVGDFYARNGSLVFFDWRDFSQAIVAEAFNVIWMRRFRRRATWHCRRTVGWHLSVGESDEPKKTEAYGGSKVFSSEGYWSVRPDAGRLGCSKQGNGDSGMR